MEDFKVQLNFTEEEWRDHQQRVRAIMYKINPNYKEFDEIIKREKEQKELLKHLKNKKYRK